MLLAGVIAGGFLNDVVPQDTEPWILRAVLTGAYIGIAFGIGALVDRLLPNRDAA
jgi:hypothetical protein